MGYTTDLASADAFLRAILLAAQANPDPTSWSPLASSPGARDALLLASAGLRTLHVDENGVVTSSQDGVSQALDATGPDVPFGGGSPASALDLPAAGAGQTYTTDLASADAFLRDVLTAAQANPDPSSWSPITSNTSARDAMVLTANGLQTLHFDENGAVTSRDGPSQQPSPSGALTPDAASPSVLALNTGAGAGAAPDGGPVGALPFGGGSPTPPSGDPSGDFPDGPIGGLPSGGGSPTPPSGGPSGGLPDGPFGGGSPTAPSGGPAGGVYTSDLSAADPVLRQVLELLQSNSDPTTWPAIEGVAADMDLAVFGPSGVSGLHIDDQGDATPSPLEGFGPPIDPGATPLGGGSGLSIDDFGASGSGWLLDS
jgi:hypothetical protein